MAALIDAERAILAIRECHVILDIVSTAEQTAGKE